MGQQTALAKKVYCHYYHKEKTKTKKTKGKIGRKRKKRKLKTKKKKRRPRPRLRVRVLLTPERNSRIEFELCTKLKPDIVLGNPIRSSKKMS